MENTNAIFTISSISNESFNLTPSGGPNEEKEKPADFEKAILLSGYGKFNYLLLSAAMVGILAHQSDMTSMSYLLPSAECDLQLTPFDKGLLNAVPFIGMIASSFMWGFLSDSSGRQFLLVIAYAIDGVCNLMASLSQVLWTLLVLKFFSGFIICGPLSMMKTYLSEFHGTEKRAQILMWNGVLMSIGNILIPAVAWLVIPQPWSWSLFDGYIKFNSWRLFVMVCALPSILAATCIFFFAESPKFLMSHGRYDEALRVFRTIYTVNTGKRPSTYPVKSLQYGHKLNSEAQEMAKRKDVMTTLKLGWKETKLLFLPPHLSKAALIFTIQFGTILGLNTIRLWLPQLFATMEEFSNWQELSNSSVVESATLCEMLSFVKNLNQTKTLLSEGEHCTMAMVNDTVYINAIIVGVVSAIGFTLASFLINRLGKKNIVIYSFIIAGASSIAVNWSQSVTTTLALASIFVTLIGICCMGIMTILVDVFPTSLRNMALSLSLMFGQVGAMTGNLVFPILLEFSCITLFLLLGVLTLCCAALSAFLPTPPDKSHK